MQDTVPPSPAPPNCSPSSSARAGGLWRSTDVASSTTTTATTVTTVPGGGTTRPPRRRGRHQTTTGTDGIDPLRCARFVSGDGTGFGRPSPTSRSGATRATTGSCAPSPTTCPVTGWSTSSRRSSKTAPATPWRSRPTRSSPFASALVGLRPTRRRRELHRPRPDPRDVLAPGAARGAAHGRLRSRARLGARVERSGRLQGDDPQLAHSSRGSTSRHHSMEPPGVALVTGASRGIGRAVASAGAGRHRLRRRRRDARRPSRWRPCRGGGRGRQPHHGGEPLDVTEPDSIAIPTGSACREQRKRRSEPPVRAHPALAVRGRCSRRTCSGSST